jgi:hypothetical protein
MRFYCNPNSASSVKSFDAWGFVEHSLIESAASKERFAGTLLLIGLMRENRQASRVLTIEDSCGVS